MAATDQPLSHPLPSHEPSEHDLLVRVQREKNQKAIELLEVFLEGDEEEQTESWEYIKAALDEDRPEGFKLFPDAVNHS